MAEPQILSKLNRLCYSMLMVEIVKKNYLKQR